MHKKPHPTLSMSTVLRAEGLVLTHRESKVVNNVSLALPARGAIALIGPNGAGKSSLLSMLAGLQTPNAGTVFWNDRPLQQCSIKERACGIGYMPQRFAPHWDITLAELLQMRLTQPSAVDALLNQYDLGNFAQRRWHTLSGGEQARSLLATVLATDPPVLLADEPGAALDVRHRLELVESLVERGRERLVVVVMHDLDLAFSHFDRVIAMEQGNIVQDRPAIDLLNDTALDDLFQVHFDRISAAPETLLRARRRAQSTQGCTREN